MPQITDVSELLELFDRHGDSEYGGEAVTQLQHALQSAQLAEQAGAPATLIAAALLHDVGHLLHDLPDDAPDRGIDDHHENSGCHSLHALFDEEVTEPIRLHVAAKRYLCAVEPAYFELLSGPSIVSLELQGGPMSAEEVADFQRHPQCEAAIQLRRWDDIAKSPDAVTPPLSHYARYVRESLREGTNA
jgi:[1-hydroxy-2-(trimethylamino)ethyl]phosphonate dioxygenase